MMVTEIRKMEMIDDGCSSVLDGALMDPTGRRKDGATVCALRQSYFGVPQVPPFEGIERARKY